jgi:ATP-dependent DNA helicase RecG
VLELNSLEDISALRETFDVECKLAGGKNGNGALPKSFWETYSAFANTEGGDIFLGLAEKSEGGFELVGIRDTAKVLDEMWSGLNDQDLVSGNILQDRWVQVVPIDGVNIIHVHVPRAPRKQRPVYIKGNPVKGTYRRFNSADIRQPEESVRRMLAEQIEDSRDNEILKGYGLDDVDQVSFDTYRQRYANLHPDHPWNHLDAQEFLQRIGGWRTSRESGYSGLTRAGLLMFGKLHTIKEAFPNYMLDYQERPEARTEPRWIDRVTLDGTWSGNLFDFYQRIIRKLTIDLKVPFILEGDQRQDDTLVHKAIREALVNTLVHADYTGRASVLVVKRPDMFSFRNPGSMRVPSEIAVKGGDSDCRNRLLQDMFRYIGLGENAGSGLPKIYHGWSSQHWRAPTLVEKQNPSEQTLLDLHTLSLVPEDVLIELRENIGSESFDVLNENERLILVTAHIETTVDHRRMMEIMDIHPRDLTTLFAGLVEKGLLCQEGTGRGTVYFLAKVLGAITEFIQRNPEMAGGLGDSSGGLGDSSGGLGDSSGGLGDSSGGLGDSSGGLEELRIIAEPVARKKKAPKLVVEATILELCKVSPLTMDTLASLLHRSSESLRKDYLHPMIKDKRLRYRFPTKPQHPQQAYITAQGDEQ